MEYITVTQLSKRWNVSPRYIQYLCRDGRLSGAVRMGKMWMLPEDVERPANHRYRSATELLETREASKEVCWSVIGAEYHVPGSKAELLKSLVNQPDEAQLVEAQFAYLRGDITVCTGLAAELFERTDHFEIKIGTAFLGGLCAMYSGDVSGWKRTRRLIEELPCPNEDYKARKEMWLAIYGASIYDMSGYPDWFCRGCFDTLPAGYYAAARVHYMKYLYLRGDALVRNQPLNIEYFRGQLFLLPAICEPLISQTALEKSIVSEITLRLICASSYHHAGEDALAIAHIDRALTLAMPDQLYAPFAENRTILDSLIDARIKAIAPDELSKVKALSVKLMAGWTVIHNTILNRSHSIDLTAKELEAARLAVFGLTNTKIAERMGISINSVKGYLQAAKEKLGVRKRSELARFI